MNYRSSLYHAIFLCNILFTIFASFHTNFPGGWQMFSRVTLYDLSLYDKDNKYIEVFHYLPRSSYILDAKVFYKIASHICHVNTSRRPYYIRDNVSNKIIQSRGCKF